VRSPGSGAPDGEGSTTTSRNGSVAADRWTRPRRERHQATRAHGIPSHRFDETDLQQDLDTLASLDGRRRIRG